MTNFFGMKRLLKPDDWKSIVGEKNWVVRRSAFELAHSWQGAQGFPEAVRSVFRKSEIQILKQITPELGLVEFPVFLDTRKAPSMTDTMVYCRSANDEDVVIAVEGKATESFGPQIAPWLRGDEQNVSLSIPVRPTRVKRLAFLSEVLRLEVPHDSTLRYQLLHRTVSAVLEASKTSAAAAVMLVHSFAESQDNWDDFATYLRALEIEARKDSVLGPKMLGVTAQRMDVPTYFAWVSDEPTSGSP